MIQLIRGFKDILPGESELWQHIECVASSILKTYGFKEIRIPIVERTELFARSIGEDTDIVEKEMYTFPDRKGDLITLRPEATASVVRSYIQHNLYAADPIQKFYTIGPMFRRERPQKGRYRQFYQINAEIFGSDSPYVDAQLIIILSDLLGQLSVPDIHAHINSLGCPQCRPNYKIELTRFTVSKANELCSDCNRRRMSNPLRVLDCKVPTCRDAMAQAPVLSDYLCSDCRSHFEIVKNCLQRQNISYLVDHRLVRGLDYYARTTFEIQTGSLGAQNAVAGGGRYDGLIKLLGGPDIPGIGFAIGFDRLVEITNLKATDFQTFPMIFIAALGDQSRALAFEWSCTLGRVGIFSETDFSDKSLKSLMKRADRLKAKYVLIVGDDEISRGSVIIRNMQTKHQESVALDHVIDHIKMLR